jgi:hypothetical protein
MLLAGYRAFVHNALQHAFKVATQSRQRWRYGPAEETLHGWPWPAELNNHGQGQQPNVPAVGALCQLKAPESLFLEVQLQRATLAKAGETRIV